MKTLTKILKTMRALFQIDQAQPKAVLVLLLLTPVLLSSCEDFDYSFPEIADDAKPRHVYYKAGECESPFVATLPVDNTDYLRTDTPTLKAAPTCNSSGTAKKFSHWQISDSGNDGEHQPGDQIPFTRHGKYFNATAIWQCMRETYDLDGGTGEIVPACKDPNQTYSLSDGRDPQGKFVTKTGYYLEKWQVVSNGDGTAGGSGLNASGWKAPDDDTKAMPKLKAVWKPAQVTVTLDKKGHGIQSVVASQTKTYTDTVNVPALTEVGYNFGGWQNGSSTAPTGSSVAISSLWNGATSSNDKAKKIALTAKWEPIPVTGVSLNTTSETIYVGGSSNTTTLTATVAPTNAANKTVTWSSDNTSVATVDTTGKVTAVSVGSATITATAKDGSNKSATATIMVLLDDEVLATPTPLPSGGITFPMKTNDTSSGNINHKFAMSKKEVTYELWKKVYDWANIDGGSCDSATGQYCYTFAHKGTEGSGCTAGAAPTTKEPVTKVNWRDAVVWSNAIPSGTMP